MKKSRTTFFLSSDEEGLRSLWSDGDLGGLLPGEPRDDGGLVEGFGEGSGPGGTRRQNKKQLKRWQYKIFLIDINFETNKYPFLKT